MRLFVWNILLALNWALLSGHFDPATLGAGFALGFLLIWLLQETLGASSYFFRIRHFVTFCVRFFWKLVVANLSVARTVLFSRVEEIRPAIVAIPLKAETDWEIALLANLITLTPGTLSLDVSGDRRVLYIHALNVSDVEALRKEITDDLERPLLEVIR